MVMTPSPQSRISRVEGAWDTQVPSLLGVVSGRRVPPHPPPCDPFTGAGRRFDDDGEPS